jgi:transcriptional regulator with XRE-family HTH domain
MMLFSCHARSKFEECVLRTPQHTRILVVGASDGDTPHQEEPVTDSFNRVVGRRIRQLREAEGINQDQLAQRMRMQVGLPWTRDTVAAIETRGRPLSFVEAIGLGQVLPSVPPAGGQHRGIAALFDSLPRAQLLALSDTGEITVHGIQAALAGNPLQNATRTRWTQQALHKARRARQALHVLEQALRTQPTLQQRRAFLNAARGAAEQKAASRLGTTPAEVAAAAVSLWGRGLTEEREARLQQREHPAQPGALNTLRGHITRQLLSDIRAAIAQQKDQP